MPDVIIIGGGIAGCTTAFFLASDGVDVLLLEQSDLNTLASGSNAGSLHAQIQPEPFAEYGAVWARRYSSALPFYAASIGLWRDAASLLDADLQVAQEGGLLVAANTQEMRLIEAKAEIERAAGLEIHILDSSDLRKRAEYVSDRMVGAAYCPIEGKVNPLTAAPAFAAAAARLGANINCRCCVQDIQASGNGYQVVTDRGTFEAARVVNAAGVGAVSVAAMLGISLDIQSFPIQLGVTEPLTPLIRHLLYSGGEMLTLKQTHAGTVLIGGGWPATLDQRNWASVNRDSLVGNLRAALRIVPDLAMARIVRTWAAEVNGNESWLPLLGEVPARPGFFLNYVPWMGLSGGPAGGRIVASLVQGKEVPFDIDVAPFLPH